MASKHYNGSLYRKIAKKSNAIIEGLPEDYIVLSVPVGNSTKLFIFCQKKLSNGEYCDFCIRRDSLKGDPEKLKHICKHINRLKFLEKPEKTNPFKNLSQSVNKFTATANLSFKQVTSKDFREVILSAISLGQENHSADPEMLFPKVSRKSFTAKWNEECEKLFARQLKEYSKQAGSALAIDAGKHKSRPYLLVIITNILISTPPLLLKSIKYFGGKSIDYKTVMTEVITDLMKDGIKISGIITDNLRSQTSAVNHRMPNSFQNSPYRPKYIKSVIWISCACHSLALAINDMIKKNEEFSTAYDNLSAAVSFLRTKNIINVLEAICPAICPTRWTGIFDIASWIINYNKPIIDALKCNLNSGKAYDVSSSAILGITTSAKKLFLWLLPYKIASEKLESERLSAGYIQPVVHSAFELSAALEKKYLPDDDNMPGILRESVKKRMFNTTTGRILAFLYLATPEGRNSFRIQNHEAVAGVDKIIPETDFSLRISNKTSKLINIIITDEFSKNADDLLSSYNNYNGTLLDPSYGLVVDHDIRDEDESILKKATRNEFEVKELKLSDESEDEDDDIDEPYEVYIDVSRGWLTIATHAIDEIATQQQKTNEEKEDLINFFIEWVTGVPDLIITQPQFLNFGIRYWQKVYDDEIQTKFARFVLPLLSLPSCEAVCERAFWYQRRVLGDLSLRTGTKTEIHRLNYILQHNKSPEKYAKTTGSR